MKGIILAGGRGTRLYPSTIAVSKQLLPVYNKPLIFYPISTLMLAGIKEILFITMPDDIAAFKRLLGNGSQFGMSFQYAPQPVPRGLADAFIIGEEFIGGDSVMLCLGDNFFFGHDLKKMLRTSVAEHRAATIFAYGVKDPERYGIVTLDRLGRPLSIEEKPKQPKSNLAVPGLYCYDNNVSGIAKGLKPSARGEIEITDINRHYMDQGSLRVVQMGRGFAWLDAGTHDSLHQASSFIETMEERTGLMIGCPEEISYLQGWINEQNLRELAGRYHGNSYGEYLLRLARTEIS